MGFLLESSQLLSRTLRINQIAQNFDNLLEDSSSTNTIRKIEDGVNFIDSYDQGGNFLDRVWNFGKGSFGFLASFVKGIEVTASWIVGLMKTGWTNLINFDWNASDASLQQQMKNANSQIAASIGSYIGQLFGTQTAIAVGYLIAIGVGIGINFILPGAGLVIGPALAAAVAWATLKERLPELLDELKLTFATITGILIKNALTTSFIWIRNQIKKAFPDNEGIQNWGKGDRWTIAESFEEWVEGATGNQLVNTALEEASEEFYESFWETGFVFANNLDLSLQQARIIREEVLGRELPEVRIELDPDSNESIILPNQPSRLAQQQVLTEISQFRRIRNRDIGYFSGEPIEEESRRFNFLRTGKVVFRGVQKPPFGSSKEATITLKDLKPQLKWRDFKQALESYNWGNHWVWITLNRSRHEIGAWFATVQEGEKYLKKLVELLINDDYIAIDSTTEVERNKYVRKSSELKLMYPSHLVITVKTPVTDREDATHDLAGNSYEKNLKKIPLWTDIEPPLDGDSEFLT